MNRRRLFGLREAFREEISAGPAAPTSDEELLRRFVVERDDRAFAELVGRHGGMVLGVCRRVSGSQSDAEDAFQAVFLVLARKANSLRRGGSLPAWLHKTAFRTSLRARADRARRREQSAEDLDMIAAAPLGEISSEHDRSIVDEELNRLPERYRLPLFLCCVEGKSLDVAARQLGWSLGSVKGRLERGRRELRRRLLLRRVPFALGFALLATLAPAAQASTAVAPSLIASTVQAGMQYAAGQGALGYVSQNALNLAHGSWNIMSLTATKVAACSAAVVGIVVLGGSRLPSPAAAGGYGAGRGIVLQAEFAGADGAEETLVALADEREAGARRGSPEGEARRESSPEGEARRDNPRESEARREAPRDGRRAESRERDGEPRREAAPESRRNRDGEEAERRDERPSLEGFRPQTDREEVLFQMIQQLRREVAELRRAVETRGAAREDGGARAIRREGAPREGAAREETGRRESEGEAKRGPRDGEGEAKKGPRDGEGEAKRGPRDGEAPRKTAPRESDQ